MLSERKTGLFGKSSQAADPHPPKFGNALFLKKMVYFSFQDLRNIFGFQKIIIIFGTNLKQRDWDDIGWNAPLLWAPLCGTDNKTARTLIFFPNIHFFLLVIDEAPAWAPGVPALLYLQLWSLSPKGREGSKIWEEHVIFSNFVLRYINQNCLSTGQSLEQNSYYEEVSWGGSWVLSTSLTKRMEDKIVWALQGDS